MRPTPRFITFALLAAFIIIPMQPVVAAPSIDDFLDEPDVVDADLSPDGKHLALIINEPDRRIVVVRNVETPDMPIVGAFSEAMLMPAWLSWANNDRLLISLSVSSEHKTSGMRRSAYVHGSNPIDFFRMVSVSKNLTDMALLMEDEKDLKRNISLSRVRNYLSKDSDHVLMAAYRGSKRTLYKVNINTGDAELIATGSSRTYRFFSDDAGNPLYRFDYRERKQTIEIFKLAGDSEWELVDKLPLSSDDEDSIDSNGLVAMSEDGDLVYRKRNEETGYYEILMVDRSTKERHVLAALEGQDIYGALFDYRSDQISGYRVEKDYVRNVYFEETWQQQYDAIAASVGNYNFDVSSLDPDIERALVGVYGPDAPYTYYLWDFSKQELIFLDHKYHSLAPENLSAPAVTNYKARDGTRLRAYALLPAGFEPGKSYPTIILPHGGPQSRSRPTYSDFAQFLSTRGYIVVEPNFRGSVGYGEDFETAGYKQWGGLMQDDLTDAVNFMVAKGYSDPERICIVGISYGGYAALMGAIKTPDLYQCAISINGVTHLQKMIKYDMKVLDNENDWERLVFDRIGHPDRDSEMLDANSPALHADKISVPVMIVGSTDDEIVPFQQAKLMVSALKKADVEYQFIRLEDSPHNPFYYREDVILVFGAVERFLAAFLY